jgi:hypothetical protein
MIIEFAIETGGIAENLSVAFAENIDLSHGTITVWRRGTVQGGAKKRIHRRVCVCRLAIERQTPFSNF